MVWAHYRCSDFAEVLNMEFQIVLVIAFSVYYQVDTVPCLQHQMQFQSSCYEFVEMQLNFSSAQGWCKGAGGHLAFIKSEEVHRFLKSHITDINNRWIGLAYATYDLIPESDTKGKRWIWILHYTWQLVYFRSITMRNDGLRNDGYNI